MLHMYPGSHEEKEIEPVVKCSLFSVVSAKDREGGKLVSNP